MSAEDRLLWCIFRRQWLPRWPAWLWLKLGMSSDFAAHILFREIPKEGRDATPRVDR